MAHAPKRRRRMGERSCASSNCSSLPTRTISASSGSTSASRLRRAADAASARLSASEAARARPALRTTSVRRSLRATAAISAKASQRSRCSELRASACTSAASEASAASANASLRLADSARAASESRTRQAATAVLRQATRHFCREAVVCTIAARRMTAAAPAAAIRRPAASALASNKGTEVVSSEHCAALASRSSFRARTLRSATPLRRSQRSSSPACLQASSETCNRRDRCAAPSMRCCSCSSTSVTCCAARSHSLAASLASSSSSHSI
mmetsp:Transcript_5581/g.15456  ORF Transcript_5581/g.15456 Transcript_5581/m.15456 type:complete len:271 (+) Transcript_5581:666-1478(+)